MGYAAGGWRARARWRGKMGLAAVCALLLLNVADALFTRGYLKAGVATEANPIMRAAFDVSPALFLSSKLVLVAVCALTLWMNRSRLLAGAALLASLAMYAAVVAYHLAFLGSRVLLGGTVFP